MNEKVDFYLEGIKKENNNIVELQLRIITFFNDSPIPRFDIVIKNKKEVIDMINNGTAIHALVYNYDDDSIFGKSDLVPLAVVDNNYLRLDNKFILEDDLGNSFEFE